MFILNATINKLINLMIKKTQPNNKYCMVFLMIPISIELFQNLILLSTQIAKKNVLMAADEKNAYL